MSDPMNDDEIVVVQDAAGNCFAIPRERLERDPIPAEMREELLRMVENDTAGTGTLFGGASLASPQFAGIGSLTRSTYQTFYLKNVTRGGTLPGLRMTVMVD